MCDFIEKQKENKKPTRWKLFLWVLLLAGEGSAVAAPEIKLGSPENYCVTYCYVRVPFTIPNYGVRHKIGRIFCDFDVDVVAKLPIYNGETRTKDMQTSVIGVFKSEKETAKGDVEFATGVIKDYFIDAKLKSLKCHL